MENEIFDTIGQTGLIRSDGYVEEEWLSQLQGIRGVRVYREMRDNDSTVGAAIHVITSLLQRTPWTVEPADGSEEARETADFLEGCLGDMSHTWEDLISEILSMIWFGWSYFEKVYKTREGPDHAEGSRRSKYADGRIGIRKISIRAQETLDQWDFDEDGGIRGMWQVAAPDYVRRFIPIEKAILFRTEIDKNNPEGRSLLRNAYRSWFFLKRIQEIEAIGMERDLVGLPVIHLPFAYLDADAPPAKQAAARNFETLLQQIRRNQHEGVLFPAETDTDGNPTGFKLSLLSSGGQRQMDVGEAIRRYQKDISMTLLTQFLFLGMDKVGSFSLSSDQTDIFTASLGAIMDNMQSTLNRFLVPELMTINGIPEQLWPVITHGDIEKQDTKNFSEMVANLVNSGIVTPDPMLEEHVREEVGLPPVDEYSPDPFIPPQDIAENAVVPPKNGQAGPQLPVPPVERAN
jgi:hypothetical protein